MNAKELFSKSAAQAWGCVKEVRQEHLSNKTPCTEWDLRALLNHMVNELLWIPEMLDGKTIADVGDKFDGDLLGDDPVAAWKAAADAARQAIEATDPTTLVHLSYGDHPAERYIAEVGADILIHGWDVGQAIQCSQIFETDVAQAVYDQLAPHIQEYRDAGVIAEPINVSDNADIQTRLLAICGRKSTAT